MTKSKLEKNDLPEDKVWASPTKKFFVEMLTRDIDLMDAIMDLVDNSLDGVHRENKGKRLKKGVSIYAGYYAHITLNKNEFIIRDNCGGIPENVAKNYAFKMGREDSYKDDDNLETVGVYGIGMKRAIFKIGLEATVISRHANGAFQVNIPKNWSKMTGAWYFNFEKHSISNISSILKNTGTLLKVSSLHSQIGEKFDDKIGFEKNLREKLNQHYGYIIEKGFTIKLNGFDIEPLELNILSTDPIKGASKSIKPYVYFDTIDEVEIEVIIGFYRPPAETDEIDNELDGSFAKSSSERAGITVLCNDRVVLFANKDHLTGWGESPVPSYHTQFINIAGVVHFRSSKPFKLPVTTTKRGLDTSSSIYSVTKQRIKNGIKAFTTFTNHWKSPSEQRSKLFKSTTSINALVPGQTRNKVFKLKKSKKGDNGLYQIPDLPRPDDDKKDKFVIISFSREKSKIDDMQDFFFEGENKPASEIGAWCFDELYSKIN